MATLNIQRQKLPWSKPAAEQSQKWDDERDGFLNSAAWRKLQKVYRRAHPICEFCIAAGGAMRPTEHIDHSVARSQGGAPLAWDNLMAACIPHHSRKTRMEANGPICETIGEHGDKRPKDRTEIIRKVNQVL